MVTPLRKAASYEPRISVLGIWGDTWLTRGKYGIYVAVRGSYGVYVTPSARKISPIYCRVSYVAVTRIPSLVLRNTWHYVIIRYSYGELPKFVLRCSYEAALRKGVTTALCVFTEVDCGYHCSSLLWVPLSKHDGSWQNGTSPCVPLPFDHDKRKFKSLIHSKLQW